jgi:molecular chaperone Hsp33
VAAGLILQHMPEGEVGRERLHVRHDHPDWEHAMIMAGTLKSAELTDLDLPLRDVVWRLFHEEGEIRVMEDTALAKGCRCDMAHFTGVLSRFPADERGEMADEHGQIIVDCAFCSRKFAIPLDDLG